MHQAPALPTAPHVIVVGNEKGGSGKTTIAIHIAIALLKDGQRVATIDLDSNQKSLTHYIENRRIWAKHRGIELETPIHRHVPRAEGANLKENEAADVAAFESAVSGFQESVDFLVIDTPANDGYLMRLAHLVADTLLTPLNDSFLDLGTLGSIDPVTHEVTETGHYAAMVAEARRQRRLFDGSNCAERITYRQLFPAGLTAFDLLDEPTLGARPSRLHLAARQEVRDLYALLQLPTNDRARRRAAARAEWYASSALPLETGDVLAE
jgi:chromosome partitioning protein